MAGCRFKLLGSLQIELDDEVITPLPGGKARLLLAYLILSFDMPQSRRQIAFDFWPDSTEKQALSNLRKVIHDLRESFPQMDPYLKITPAYLQWNNELPCYSDVYEFEQAAKGQSLHMLQEAEELYRGELLPGYYEDWLNAKRELLAQLYADVLEKLIAILETQREYSSALFFANKLLIQNRLREETYRTLMRLYALKNDMAGVAQTYQQLQGVLEAEFGIGPAEATLQLFERLVQNRCGHAAAVHSETPFIGRTAEWESMLSVWKQAAAGQSSLIVLKGEAGIGKTRLSREFMAWVKGRGIQTVFAGCYLSVRSISYTPVTSWLRSLPLPQLNPVCLSELARLLPELLEEYPDLAAPNPVQENWQLNKWYEAIERMLLAEQPLLLILDDIQWSDTGTLQLISFLLRGDSRTKLLVAATMRTDEDANGAVTHLLSSLRTERKLTEIELAPFSETDTKRLMTATVGDVLADRHSAGLYAETGGNPLFIVETMREWQTGSDKNEFRLSPMVITVIENRLNRLSPIDRQLVSAMAAIGRPASAAFMTILTDMEEEAVLERIEQLVLVKVLQETGDGKYDFAHDMIRESAYKLKSESRRRQCHRQIAHSLNVFHHGQTETAAAEIALHFELAGMNREAIVYYEMAALAAEKIYANETRINYYQKLCILLPFGQILPILMKLGEALIITGNWKESERIYKQWFERSGSSATIQERSLCDVALGNCLRMQGKYEEASFHLERALRCFELLDDYSGLSTVYVTLGTLHYYRGKYDEVLYYLMKRMELPGIGNQTREDCRSFGIIGHIYYDRCEYDQSIHWIKKQIALATETGDKYTIEQAMGVLAMVYMDMDEMDLAFGFIVDKMEISKSIGDRMGFAIAHGMLGKYYLCHGELEQAAPCIAFCLEEAVWVKDLRIAGIMLGFEGL
ncbi:AAA family ATPase, partial [Paenibacillus sepulcri]|nr:AAA family ATPase [Paenibacillus sepulcri]